MTTFKVVRYWDNESIAFCFEKGLFLCHFPSKNMVVIGNKFDDK